MHNGKTSGKEQESWTPMLIPNLFVSLSAGLDFMHLLQLGGFAQDIFLRDSAPNMLLGYIKVFQT